VPALVEILLTNLTVIAVLMILLWAASVPWRDASIADVFWGIGFVVVAWVSWSIRGAAATRAWLLIGLVTAWGARLAIYLMWRKWGEGEDRRYAALRQRQAPHFWWFSLFSVFLLQGAILWFVSLTVQVAVWRNDPAPLCWLDGLGVVLWSVGFYFEAVGDWQLARFKRNPLNHDRVMDRGLWRLTRHPNYFGDFCVWWGIYAIAAAGGAAATIASPALISLLLLKVSGVELLEQTMTERRPDYAEYKRRTNAFLPGPPRRT
jgi:steroid 5-alpha reductase family enzyme